MIGRGSLRRHGGGAWRVTVDDGCHPVTGRRRQRTRVVHGSRLDAVVVRNEMMLAPLVVETTPVAVRRRRVATVRAEKVAEPPAVQESQPTRREQPETTSWRPPRRSHGTAGIVGHPFSLTSLLEEVGVRQLGRRIGVSSATLFRWRASGVDEFLADEIAVALGVHPVEVWPEWFDLVGRGGS